LLFVNQESRVAELYPLIPFAGKAAKFSFFIEIPPPTIGIGFFNFSQGMNGIVRAVKQVTRVRNSITRIRMDRTSNTTRVNRSEIIFDTIKVGRHLLLKSERNPASGPI